MKRVLAGLAMSAVLLAAVPASAGEPYYFHKPGVGRDAYMYDVAFCQSLAGGVKNQGPSVYISPNIYATLALSFFQGFAQGGQRRATASKVERTCMADRGYTRIAVDKASHKQIRKLDDEQRLDRLFALAGAPQPLGTELPE